MGSPGTNLDLGSGGFGRAMFFIDSIERLPRKLCRVILLLLRVVTFRIHFPKLPKVFICMMFGPSGRDHGHHNQVFRILDTPKLRQTLQDNLNHVQTCDFGKLQNLAISTSFKCWKRWGPEKSGRSI